MAIWKEKKYYILGNMKPEYLETCLRRVSHFAKEENYVIHTPRLGKGCDISWYMVGNWGNINKKEQFRWIDC